MAQMLHVWNIYIHWGHKYGANVGKYSMEHLGGIIVIVDGINEWDHSDQYPSTIEHINGLVARKTSEPGNRRNFPMKRYNGPNPVSMRFAKKKTSNQWTMFDASNFKHKP